LLQFLGNVSLAAKIILNSYTEIFGVVDFGDDIPTVTINISFLLVLECVYNAGFTQVSAQEVRSWMILL